MLSKIKEVDKTLLFFIICICLFGLIMVYSASYPLSSVKYDVSTYFFHRQWISFLIGLFAMSVGFFLPYKLYRQWNPLLVIGSILVLILVLTPWFGESRNNSQRWLELGPVTLQPAEFVKFTMVVYFASVYGKNKNCLLVLKRKFSPALAARYGIRAHTHAAGLGDCYFHRDSLFLYPALCRHQTASSARNSYGRYWRCHLFSGICTLPVGTCLILPGPIQ